MKETKFIEQNKEKWGKFERILAQKQKDPEVLSRLFIELTDDLSYSRTFYPARSVRVYLNQLAQKVFLSLYKTEKGNRSKLLSFWTEDMPYIIYQSRKAFFLSLALFVLSFIIGVVSSIYDPDFATLILGEEYIAMTLENIKKGDPMGVYKDSGEVDMFTYITLNNLKVDFITFLSGLLASIGSVLVMLYNGIMVGTFQYFFIERGLFWESFLTIWVHGSLEIPTIIISGAAGMVLGSGLIFPGTLTRFQSFLVSARRGLMILLGVLPITVVAGFIEAFLTRYTETPPVLRGIFILVAFSAVLVYYVYYPYIKYKRGFAHREKNDHLASTPPVHMPLETTRSVGQIFADTFVLYGQMFGKIFPAALAIATVYALYFVLVVQSSFFNLLSSSATGLIIEQMEYIGNLTRFFNHHAYPLMAPANVLLVGVVTTLAGAYIYMAAQGHSHTVTAQVRRSINLAQFVKTHWLILVAFSVGFGGVLFLPSAMFWLFFVPVGPYLAVSLAAALVEGTSFIRAMRKSAILISGRFADFIGLHLLLLLISCLFLSISASGLVWFYFEFIQMNLLLDAETYPKLLAGFIAFNVALGASLVLPIFLFAYTLFFYNVREISEATGLLTKIDSIGQNKRIYGLEQEA